MVLPMAEISTSTENSRSAQGFADDVWRWLKAVAAAADEAGDDPQRCVIVADMIRSIRDGLVAQQLRDQLQQKDFLILTEASVGENSGFEVGHGRSVDRQPPQVA